MGDFFMEKIKLTKGQKKYFIVAAVSFLVYGIMKYVSPIITPFIFAFLLAGLLNPLVQGIHNKTKIRKPFLAGIILFAICVLVVALIWMLLSALVTGGGRLAVELPVYQKELCLLLGDCCDRMEQKFGIDGVQIESFIIDQVNFFIDNLEVNVLPQVMGKSVNYVKNIISFLSIIVVMIIAVLLIMKDYDKYAARFREEREFEGIREVGKKVLLYVKTFIKAQLVILGIISTLCAVTLTAMGMKGGILYGILTGIMDMLPFIGTGIMLIPLAIFRLVSGNYWQALFCFCLYGACALVREFLEPKLIGEKIGVWPVGILFAVFAGIHLFGVWGIMKGPLSLVIICETCKYLWREQK